MELIDGHDLANAGVLIEDGGGRVMVGIEVAQTGFGAADELRVAEHDQRRGGIGQDRAPKLLDRVIWPAMQQVENEEADQERASSDGGRAPERERARFGELIRRGRCNWLGRDAFMELDQIAALGDFDLPALPSARGRV